MRYTVWQRGLSTSHTAPLFSSATAFHILLSLVCKLDQCLTSHSALQVVLIAPLLVAYRSQGFWMRSATYQEQAEVQKSSHFHVRFDKKRLTRFTFGMRLLCWWS